MHKDVPLHNTGLGSLTMIAAMAAAVSAISLLRLMSDCAGFSVTTGVDSASTDLVEFEVGGRRQWGCLRKGVRASAENERARQD
jgi:hypothetical protein